MLRVAIISIITAAALTYPQNLFHSTATASQESVVYSCPMHPEVQSSTPGKCPKCNMQLVAPSKEAAERKAAEQTADAYTCPMHLDVRSNSPGKCPKCQMTLVPALPAIPEDFDLDFQVAPKAPKPNEKVRLRFAVFNPKNGEQAKQFGTIHEKLFHLFIVSQDMNEFQHIHPDFEPDGSFSIETVLPRPGYYRVYCDLFPVEGIPQVLHTNLVTAGYKGDLFSNQAHLEPDKVLTKTIDGMKIELTLEPPVIIGGRPATLKYHLTDSATGQPVKNLAPYLGALGHTLILSEDQAEYVHSHPEELIPETEDRSKAHGGPDVTFGALLPRPGVYRVWTQFLRGETLTTVSFTIKAERLY